MHKHAYPVCSSGHGLPNDAQFCPQCGSPRQEITHDADISVDPEADAVEPAVAAIPPTPSTGSRRLVGRSIAAAVAVALIGAAGFAGWFAFVRTTDEDRLVAELKSTGLLEDYGSAEVALAQGNAFCAQLRAGAEGQGYRSQQLAVEHLCPEMLAGFEVVPTPEEQQTMLTETLRDQGLGGVFASDAAAVAHANNVCQSLNDGGPQQGPEEDAASVAVYCPEYEAGFKTLRPIKVRGSFSLLDSDPSYYYPSIAGRNQNCYGDNGYSDIHAGTEVVVKNASGDVLATTQLGTGRGFTPVTCKFKFKFTVMDGEEGKYSVTVADRGELHYSAAELKIPNTIALSLGD